MKRLLITAPLLAALLAAATTSCGDSRAKSSRETDAARALAAREARALAQPLAMDTVEIERRLIDVRSREAELRRRGHPEVADTYVATFLSTLDSVNPALAAELTR